MNTELLLKVKEHILAHPEQLNMGTWRCETVGCIGGWAVTLSDIKDPGVLQWEPLAILLLELPIGAKLLYANRWPKHWQDKYEDHDQNQDAKGMASVTAQVIDEYIATGGWK